ncbi:urease accessory protein D-like isoform X4 [Coffea eugenioides]|uniref:urease accessory protein D-like isoform X4 n=1 Tax=Coffea eugenioides TaxID=49369 RepID=UPI000F614303|nr:urease accessory protein D-like isoform X4 [Coffea eugenioides]
METGKVVVERVGGKSAAIHCYSKYPLKFIIPNKVGPSQIDAVWIYTITYGGGIVSGDAIKCDISVGDGCTTVLTTQASTKVYKSVESKCSEQVLEILLEQGRYSSIAERMQDYQVIAMVILLGPKLKFIQDQIQENVKNLMSQQLRIPSGSSGRYGDIDDNPFFTRPSFLASCSVFGPKGRGVVVRIAAMTTESVYSFLQCQLSGLDSLLGVAPYR